VNIFGGHKVVSEVRSDVRRCSRTFRVYSESRVLLWDVLCVRMGGFGAYPAPGPYHCVASERACLLLLGTLAGMGMCVRVVMV
jgi:hypothetical protein